MQNFRRIEHGGVIPLLLTAAAMLLAGCEDDTAKAKSVTAQPYNASGVFDTSFGAGGATTYDSLGTGNDVGFAVTVASDGKIVVAGTLFNGTDRDVGVWRFMPSGILDAAFGSGGVATVSNPAAGAQDRALSVIVDSQGRIVVTGSRVTAAIAEMAVWRFFSSGAFDALLTDSGPAGNDCLGSAIAEDSNGNYVVVGDGDVGPSNDVLVWRVLSDLSGLDPTFGTTPPGAGWESLDAGAGGSDVGYAAVIQPDGKIVAAGGGTLGGISQLYLVRLSGANGAIDTTFGVAGMVVYPGPGTITNAEALLLDPTGKLVVAGQSFISTHYDGMLWRFDANGTLDTTFGSGGSIQLQDVAGPATHDRIKGLIRDSYGRLVVAGTVGSPSDMFLARFSKQGVLDTTFGTGGILRNGTLASGTAPVGEGLTVASNGSMFVTGQVTNGTDVDVALWKIK